MNFFLQIKITMEYDFIHVLTSSAHDFFFEISMEIDFRVHVLASSAHDFF